MADGMGGLISNLMMGNPMGQLQAALAPQPGAPGGSGAPGAAAMPSAPSMAQPQATQSPPDLARLYLNLEQSHQMAEGFNRGLATFLGGFKGPPGGADQIMRGMTGGPSQDPGVLLQNLLQMRNTQALMNAPPPPGVNQTSWNLLPPDLRAKVAGDIITQQAGIGGPPVIQEMQRAKMQYMKDNGITDPNDPKIPAKYTYPDQFNAASTAEGKAAGDISEFKQSAIQDYSSLDSKLDKSLHSVDQLLGKTPGASFDDTMTALTTLKPTTGKFAANMPPLGGYNPLATSQAVKDQANAVNVLKGELSAETMEGVKNIRNKQEFGAVTSSLTGAFDAANSPEKVQQSLQLIRDKLLRARAIATASAGYKLTGDLIGQLGQDENTYLNPSSPYYNGATQEELKTPASDDLKAGQAYIIAHPNERDSVVQHFRSQGLKTDGL